MRDFTVTIRGGWDIQLLSTCLWQAAKEVREGNSVWFYVQVDTSDSHLFEMSGGSDKVEAILALVDSLNKNPLKRGATFVLHLAAGSFALAEPNTLGETTLTFEGWGDNP